ncbi:CinA-like protein [Sulfidibacter corallicola]|uniref:CinA-like protein n=1 Tax=Sulfidibacter corallicola TaxID=2818388 RepID=A0A8A4TYE7_SULCO|nr:CinA family nicotinamide mononucleotide deamidase-related protein [Sulfidibacter corallicola]QTD53972.1 CinA family nicotinamide mononucleotide deamidase-related protein [Sulfidibacter corallicola]
MRVEIMTTGEEVLSGQIVDSNAAWISQILSDQGLETARCYTIGDRLEELTEVMDQRAREADLIIVNGGLGPTDDDFSAQAAARALGEPLVEFSEWVEALRHKFTRSGRELTARNLKQAMLPRSATMLDNPRGTACGFVIRLHRAWLYFTPGPPNEMRKMMRDEVMPHLRAHADLPPSAFIKKMTCFGLGESRINDLVAEIPLPEGTRLGFRAHFPYTEIKIMGFGDETRARVDQVAEGMRGVLGANLLFEDDQSLAGCIQEAMIDRGLSLALAESCTGGMVAASLVEVPGSSAYFHRGYVTYTNASKVDMIGVPNALIESHGAVSLEVAREMALGAQKHAGTSHAVAISGIAGPDGGTDSKPVGTVAFALAHPQGHHACVMALPNWGRAKIRLGATTIALDMLRRHLLGKPVYPSYDYAKVTRSEDR